MEIIISISFKHINIIQHQQNKYETFFFFFYHLWQNNNIALKVALVSKPAFGYCNGKVTWQ